MPRNRAHCLARQRSHRKQSAAVSCSVLQLKLFLRTLNEVAGVEVYSGEQLKPPRPGVVEISLRRVALNWWVHGRLYFEWRESCGPILCHDRRVVKTPPLPSLCGRGRIQHPRNTQFRRHVRRSWYITLACAIQPPAPLSDLLGLSVSLAVEEIPHDLSRTTLPPVQYVPDAYSIPRTSGVRGRRGGLGEIVTAVLVTLLFLVLHGGV